MVHALKSAFVAVALSCSARAEINLTPTPTLREQESFKFPELLFADGAKTISYEYPRGWRYSSLERGRIRFYPAQAGQAVGEIEAIALPRPFSFDEDGAKKLRMDALRVVPKDSEHIEITDENSNPLVINGHETYEVTISFICYAQRWRESVLFVNIGKQQLRFKFTSSPDEFAQLHRAFRDSLCSLQWLDSPVK
jgi:hypothetical protein